MHIEIDIRIEVLGSARGRATAPDGMREVELVAAARSMAKQGR